MTGLSTSAVHQRVRRLEQRGIIKGYAAVVDYEALGLSLTAFISIKPIDPSQPDDSPDLLVDVPEIEDCHSVAGDENYILKVRVASPGALEELLARDPGQGQRLHPVDRRPVDAVRTTPSRGLTAR